MSNNRATLNEFRVLGNRLLNLFEDVTENPPKSVEDLGARSFQLKDLATSFHTAVKKYKNGLGSSAASHDVLEMVETISYIVDDIAMRLRSSHSSLLNQVCIKLTQEINGLDSFGISLATN